MMRNFFKCLIAMTLSLPLTACSTFFDKDNTPEPRALSQFNAEIRPRLLWSTQAGAGSSGEYLKSSPAVSDCGVYTASLKGTVTAVNRANGRINWQVNTGLPLTSGAGAGEGIVVVASRTGDVIALREQDGTKLWQNSVSSEVLANPVIAHNQVIIKSIDGDIHSFDVSNGSERWNFHQAEPSLILRGSSTPVISDNHLIAGYASGNLAKFMLNQGQLLWSQSIASSEGAFAIQRMIDIDANPIVFDHRIYAATYQGKVASLDWGSGRVLWSHDISSYTGMAATADSLAVTDAKSHVWSFNIDSGLVNWRQTDLEYRNISGPAYYGNYIVVGDSQGYLHWLSKQDGHFSARSYLGASIYAAPIMKNNVLYVINNKGYLAAYTLS